MKSVKESLLQRVSVRRYKREHLSEDEINFIYDAIRNTPTSYNGQQFSVIDVDDQPTKILLSEITGQKQIKTCDHFLVFVADYNKIKLGAEAKDVEMPEFYNSIDGYTVGVVDASLAMMSAIAAVEALGLGCCPIGYARTVNPEKYAEILHLPEHVFVVCGLSIGVPNERNDLKPKQGDDLMIHHNVYRPAEQITKSILEYDKIVSEYNATRAGGTTDHDWIKHILDYYAEAINVPMLEKTRARGFDIKK